MPIHTPQFWLEDGMLARSLQPLGDAYAGLARLHQWTARRRKVGVPVIAVGNVVAGGAGKTPVTQALVRLLQDWGFTPYILSRGYGGFIAGPVAVDIGRHQACDVGDEPLMHAAIAPTWVSRNRYKGAQAAIMAGARLIVMDDGLQNTTLAPDFGLLVVDGGFGLGNGRMMPAGPMREPLSRALQRSHAVVMVGEDATGLTEGKAKKIPDYIPIIKSHIQPDANAVKLLQGCRVIGFCGLARPEKFFNTLQSTGVEMLDAIAFPDHHPYHDKEMESLVELARNERAYLVTTQKDWINIPTRFHPFAQCLPIRLVWEDTALLQKLLLSHVIRKTPEGAA